MKITMESSEQIVSVDDGDGNVSLHRVWTGTTSKGTHCLVLVAMVGFRIGAPEEETNALMEVMKAPRIGDFYPISSRPKKENPS